MEEVKSRYLVLSRKYRPKSLSELIGQDVLVKTLSYSIQNNKLAQAYLLNGIRGVGKTTTARIIAKVINCSNLHINQSDNVSQVSSCDTCKNCQAIINNRHSDVNEIDAASRTGVDDIRKIIEDAEYKPLLAKYKVFIIDEVHMISKNAFNALLKLLEEPPAHVIFIFATTEIHKIPLTIISRCQRFDLKRLSVSEIKRVLIKALDQECVSYTNDALDLIAAKSDGSARDALSLLEQAIMLTNYCDDNNSNIQPLVDLSIAEKICGVVDLLLLSQLLESIIEGNSKKAMDIVEDLYNSGSDFVVYNENLLNLLGYLIKLKVIDNYKDIIYLNYSKILNNIVAATNVARLTMIWQIFIKAVDELKSTHNQRVSFEVAVIKAIYATSLPTPLEIIEQLQKSDNNSTYYPRQ